MSVIRYDPSVIEPYYHGANWREACKIVGWNPDNATRARDSLDLRYRRNRFSDNTGELEGGSDHCQLPEIPETFGSHGLFAEETSSGSTVHQGQERVTSTINFTLSPTRESIQRDSEQRATPERGSGHSFTDSDPIRPGDDLRDRETIFDKVFAPTPIPLLSRATTRAASLTIPRGDVPRQDVFEEMVEDRLMVMGDIHVPRHDAPFLERALAVAQEEKITALLILGDLFDFPQFRRPDTFFQTESAEKDIVLGEEILDVFLKVFDTIIIGNGNHDKWLYKHLGAHFSPSFLLSRLMNTEARLLRWSMGGREKVLRWTDKEAIRVTSGGVMWWCTHGKSYSRANPLKHARDIADRRGMPTIVAHQHHSTQGWHPNGLWPLVALGCMADPGLFEYCNTGSEPTPAMTQSFATLTRNRIRLHHRE